MFRFVRVPLVVLSIGFTSVWGQSKPISGDFRGWAYDEGGGDFPLHLRVENAAQGTVILLSLPAQKAWGLPTLNPKIDAAGLSFQRDNSQGKRWTYTAAPEGDGFSGMATLEEGKGKFSFQVQRSSEELNGRKLVKPEDYLGTYSDAKERAVVVSAWFWGELRVFDLESGRAGTLFETPKGDFILGAAEYVPSPVFARVRFQRDASGAVTGLTWSPTEGSERTLTRATRVEEEIQFQNGGVTLSGTLIKPATPGPHAAIVVLGGSGWTERSGTRSEGDLFVAQGMAAFVYDQRGYGKSGGDRIVSFDDTASDAVAAVNALKGRKDLDPQRIGLSGRSRGGWLAPLAASQSADVKFLVLFVAPAISPAEQETTRRLNAMRAEGFSRGDIEAAEKYLELQMRATKSDADWERYVPSRDENKSRPWFPIADQYESRESDDYRWSKMNMHYDPILTLEKVGCPVLALFGERDDNVTVEPNVRLMDAALRRGGNGETTLKVIPTGDHGLRPVPAMGTGIPLHRATGTVPGVWNSVGDWMVERKIVRR